MDQQAFENDRMTAPMRAARLPTGRISFYLRDFLRIRIVGIFGKVGKGGVVGGGGKGRFMGFDTGFRGSGLMSGEKVDWPINNMGGRGGKVVEGRSGRLSEWFDRFWIVKVREAGPSGWFFIRVWMDPNVSY